MMHIRASATAYCFFCKKHQCISEKHISYIFNCDRQLLNQYMNQAVETKEYFQSATTIIFSV